MSIRGRWRGQALVETALVLPLILLLGFGSIGVGRLIQVRMGLSAVAREAARAAALAPLPPPGGPFSQSDRAASQIGHDAGMNVANGYRLGTVRVQVETSNFNRGSWVRAEVRSNVGEADLHFLHWSGFELVSRHSEMVDLYRSRGP